MPYVKIGNGSGKYADINESEELLTADGVVRSLIAALNNLVATSALQTTGNASISSIDLKTPALVSGRQPVDGSGVTQPVSGTFFQATQPVSLSSVPLASGASTSALQTAGNSSLSSIDVKLPSLSAGKVPVDGSGVTQPVSGTFWQATQPVSAASLPLPTGAATSALQTTGNTSAASIDTKTPTVGQKVMSASSPVVISSDQSAIPTSQSGTWNITNVSGTVSLPTGASTAARQDTGNSSLSSIDGKFGSLGQKAMTGSAPVVIASDQTVIPVSIRTGDKVTYSAAATGITLAASATDIFTIKGSASKTVRITKMMTTATTTTAGGVLVPFSIIKRSTADTAGTSATLTNVPNDSASAAGTAVVQSWTANPTLGTAVGTIRSERVSIGVTATIPARLSYDFISGPAQAIVLRGASEQLAVNLGGTTVGGGIASFHIEWTEE